MGLLGDHGSKGPRLCVATAFVVAVGLGLLALTPSALSATFTVSSTLNSGPGTLRQAITDANALVGFDTITFAPGTTELLLKPTTALPSITTDAVVIDGSTRVDASGRPLVRIDGTALPGATVGLALNVATVNASTIKSVALTGWSTSGAAALKIQGIGSVSVKSSIIGSDGVSVGWVGNSTGIDVGNASTIGGANAGDRNVISGNTRGVRAGGGSVSGNFVGTNRAGTGKTANTEVGIRVDGANVSISNNVVSGNAAGIAVVSGGSGTTIAGNWIGATSSGAALGNAGAGISIDGASNVKIGAIPPVAGQPSNRIAFNAKGVTILSGTGNAVRGNAIYRNTSFDLDLANDGATTNDAGDGDTGANNKQNYPLLAGTSVSGGSLSVTLTLNSQPGTYAVDFFSGGDGDGDGDDCGAGGRGLFGPASYLGSATVAASGSSQTVSFTPVGLPVAATLVATATSSAGDTSELSNCTSFLNNKPTASATSATTTEDTAVNVTLSATDPNGPFPLTFAIATSPTKGTLGPIVPAPCTANPCTATVLYTPNANANGTDAFTFTAKDGTNTSPTATASITVSGVNDPPSFTKGPNQTVAEDAGAQSVAGWATGISPGPSNEVGQAVSFIVTNDNNALFSSQPAVAANGTLTFTPAADANGSATVSVTLKDNGLGADTSAPQTFTIAVSPVNDAPSFTKGADQTVLEDAGAQTVAGWATAISAGPANESSQTLAFTATNGNGALFSVQPAVAPDGTLTYTPAADANGSATVSVTLKDNGLGADTSAPQTFTIAVTAVNDVPSFTKGADQTVLEDAGLQTVAGWATGISKGAANESGQTLAFTATNDNGALFSVQPAVAPDGTLTYTPAADANGSATVSVTLKDNGLGADTSAPQMFTITVTAVNDAPSFVKGADQTVLEDPGAQILATWATAISKGPADELGQTLTFTVTNDRNSLFAAQPEVNADGRLTYAPAPNAHGVATVSVTLKDNGGGADTSAPQTFTITVTAVNDAPSFVKGADQTVDEDSGLQTVTPWATAISPGPADESQSGQTVSFVVSSDNQTLFSVQPAIASDGTLTYTSKPDATGTATVSVFAHDTGGTADGGVENGAIETFTITITIVNDDPGGSGSSVSTPEDTAREITLSATDVDGPYPLVFTIATAPTHGTLGLITAPALCLNGTCTTEVLYTPGQDFNGADSFEFAFSDGGVPLKATVAITVTPVNDAPVATPRAATTIEDAPVTITLDAKDVDQTGALAFSISTPPVHGTVTTPGASACSGDSCTVDVTYQPADGYVGDDSFAFTAGDGSLTSAPATVAVAVSLGGSAPVKASVVLLATPSEVPAGASEVPLASVSPGKIIGSTASIGSTPLANTPLANTPLANTPLSDTPLANTPLANTPLADTGLTDFTAADGAVWAALQDIPLSTVPILPGWPSILAGTPLATRVLENVTIADVLLDPIAKAKLAGVPLREIDFSQTTLGSLSALDAVVGQTLLTSIAGTDWCAALAGPPISCTSTPSLAGQTVLSVALRGAPLANTPLANTPLTNVPLADVPLANTPLADTPLANTPLSDTGLTSIPLANTPLADVPLANTPLADTPLANTPLADVPLANTPLADTPLADTPLADVDLAKFPLADVPLTNTQLAAPLADIPLADVRLPATIFTCASGCPTVGTIGSNADQLKQSLTYGVVLGALYPKTAVEIGELVRTAPNGALIGKTLGELLQSLSTGALSQITLAQLLRTDNFLGGFTVLQLLDSLDKSKLTLVDLVTLLLKPDSFDWESFDLGSLKPQTLAGVKGGVVDYAADVTLGPLAGPTGVRAPATLTPGLPTDFAYIAGSAKVVELDGLPGSTPVAGTDVALKDAAAGDPIAWKVRLKVGTTYRVTFEARPGITLGPKSTTFVATPTSTGSEAATSTASVVVVGDTFEPNDAFTSTGGGSGAVGTGAFYLSFIRQAGDIDYFTYTVPANTPEGTRITIRLSHLPKDFDLVVYGPRDVLHSTAPGTPPLDGQAAGDSTPPLTHLNETLAAQPLDDVALSDSLPAGEGVMGISTNRGSETDAVTVISRGAQETYTIQVSGFNGAWSDDPYMVRVTSTPPPALVCTPFPGSAQTPASTLTFPTSPSVNVVTGIDT